MSFTNFNNHSQLAYRLSIQDYFATPAPITEALLKHESFEGRIWEPACGEGWMSAVLKRRNAVLSTDLIYRGYGSPNTPLRIGDYWLDFLKQSRSEPNIVTNPPYVNKLYATFTTHALKLATRKVAMLLPYYLSQNLAFQRLVFDHPLKAVYVFRKRVFTVAEGTKRRRTTNVSFAWFVWDKAYSGKPVLEPIWPIQPQPAISRLTARRQHLDHGCAV